MRFFVLSSMPWGAQSVLVKQRAPRFSISSNMFLLNSRQASPKLTGHDLDVFLVEHGLVTTGNLMNFETAGYDAIPARVEVKIKTRRPIGGLKKDYSSGIGLGPIQIGGGMHDGVQFSKVLLSYLQTQRMVQ